MEGIRVSKETLGLSCVALGKSQHCQHIRVYRWVGHTLSLWGGGCMHLPGFKCTQTPVALPRRGRVALWAPTGGISVLLPKGKRVDKGCVDQTCKQGVGGR